MKQFIQFIQYGGREQIFQDLEEHFYDQHTSWKIHKCSLCSKKYNSDEELQKHICKQKLIQFPLQDHKQVPKRKINGSKTSKAHKENQTISIHKGKKQPKCKYCGKSFAQEGTLKRHIHTVHEGHKD